MARFELGGNFPNPFNAQTTIEYNIPFEADVKIEIFDILGRRIETLVNERRPTGLNRVIWNADNVASGMYFYRLQAGEYTAAKRMTILK